MSGDETLGPEMVEIEWYDSERVLLGWASAEEYLAALADRNVYRSVGYLVGEGDHFVMLALSRSASGLYGDAMVIPKAVVMSRRVVSVCS